MIVIQLDPSEFLGELDSIARRQLPYATARALNAVAFDFQSAEQEGISQRFRLRRPAFVKQGIYFPTQQRADYRRGDLSATVSIEPKRDFLSKFEQGGWKAPRSATRLAVPIDARRTKSDIVTAGDRLGALGFRLHGRGPKGTVGRGLKRTFSIRYPDGRGYIFRRIGSGKRASMRLLYLFRPRVVIPPSLEFHATAESVARARFVPAFAAAFQDALRTAR